MVSEAVVGSLRELTSARDVDSLTLEHVARSSAELTIPAIHVAYDHVQSRLKCFAELIRLDPHVIRQVCHQKGLETSKEMVSASLHCSSSSAVAFLQNLDAFAFREYLQELCPKIEDLVYSNTRREWLEKVQEARPCIETWLALPFDSTSLRHRAEMCSEIKSVYNRTFSSYSCHSFFIYLETCGSKCLSFAFSFITRVRQQRKVRGHLLGKPDESCGR